MTDPNVAQISRLNHGVQLTDDEIRVVKIQFDKDTSYPRFDPLIHEYCRFLELKLSNPDTLFAPSYLIDKLWHAHMLASKEYFAFCDRHNQGKYLHHDPTMKQGQKRYKQTLEAYKGRFGRKPDDPDIWPQHENQKPSKKRLRALRDEQAGDRAVSQQEANGTREEEQRPTKRAKMEEAKQDSEEEQEEEESDDYDSDGLDAEGREFRQAQGLTKEEVIEWHKEAIVGVAQEEGFDPYDSAQCGAGHCWIKGEFDLNCNECRETSDGLGSYSCG